MDSFQVLIIEAFIETYKEKKKIKINWYFTEKKKSSKQFTTTKMEERNNFSIIKPKLDRVGYYIYYYYLYFKNIIYLTTN